MEGVWQECAVKDDYYFNIDKPFHKRSNNESYLLLLLQTDFCNDYAEKSLHNVNTKNRKDISWFQ